MNTELDATARPGFVGRLRSRQAGHPSGILGRIIGRVMVKDTATANDHAVAQLDLTQPSTILDVGFGQGRSVANIVRAGHRVLGVDTSPTMVQQATRRNRTACRDRQATLRHGDGITIPFPDHSADAAITVHTIYFMADPATTLTDIARVLRPGGTLAIACRTSDDTTPAWFDPAIYTFRSADQIIALLQTAGFEHVEHDEGGSVNHYVHHFLARLPGSG